MEHGQNMSVDVPYRYKFLNATLKIKNEHDINASMAYYAQERGLNSFLFIFIFIYTFLFHF